MIQDTIRKSAITPLAITKAEPLRADIIMVSTRVDDGVMDVRPPSILQAGCHEISWI
jgi:hypothetical protein